MIIFVENAWICNEINHWELSIDILFAKWFDQNRQDRIVLFLDENYQPI